MKKTAISFLTALYKSMALAQEGQNSNIYFASEENPWYASPWLWVIGAAILIFLLVILSRGGKSD